MIFSRTRNTRKFRRNISELGPRELRALLEAAQAKKADFDKTRKGDPRYLHKVSLACGAEWALDDEGCWHLLFKPERMEAKTAIVELFNLLQVPVFPLKAHKVLEELRWLDWLASVVELGLPLHVKCFQGRAEAENGYGQGSGEPDRKESRGDAEEPDSEEKADDSRDVANFFSVLAALVDAGIDPHKALLPRRHYLFRSGG